VDAEAWDQRYAASELVWSREPNQFVAAELADLAPGTAVDLAAGEGRNAIWLASRGWSATAVDFSQVALDKGAQLVDQAGIELDGTVAWVCADATTWQPDEPVDLVVIAYLQLPAEDRRRAVRSAVTMLRPGGTLLLVAHDSTNLTEGTGGPQDPSVLMTADDVVDDLSGLDVEVLHAERVAREVRSADEHGGEERRTAWDCLVRVVRR
jgi:SAM-dependent methyltransferase